MTAFWQIFSGALYEWSEDKVPRMAAALAFYTVFSLTPIVVIALAVASLIFDRQTAVNEILDEVGVLIGPHGVDAIKLLLDHSQKEQASWLATIAGLATLFFASTGVFVELKDALNTIWEVQTKPGLGILEMIRDRILSFAMVLVIGFLLLVSMITSTVLSIIEKALPHYLPVPAQLLEIGNIAISFAVVALLFALIYKVLPDAEVEWKDVWLGAALTAVLFAVGKTLFGWYLGRSTIGSSYGAAGSLVIVVLWTYYSALILLFGAEVTQVVAVRRGKRHIPTEKAVHVTEHDRLQQGIPRLEDIAAAAEAGLPQVAAGCDSGSADNVARSRPTGWLIRPLVWLATGWLLASWQRRR